VSHDREFACVPEDIVRETNNKNFSFVPEISQSKETSKFIILCPAAAALYSLKLVYAESFIHSISLIEI